MGSYPMTHIRPSAPAAEIELPLKSGNLMLGAMAEDG